MKIKIDKYKKFPEGKVKGICDIILYIEGFPFSIRGVKVIMTENKGYFYALPQREYEENGEKKYASICAFVSKEGYKEFRGSMNAAFREFFQRPQPPKSVPHDTHTKKEFSDIAKFCDEKEIHHNFSY